jgi:lysophospholipase L1-like esterase
VETQDWIRKIRTPPHAGAGAVAFFLAVLLLAQTPTLAQPAPAPGPTAASAPHSIDDLPCEQTTGPSPLGPMDLLTPQAHMPPPVVDRSRLAAMRERAAIDPPGVCRYRDENRALPKPGPHRVVFLGDSITDYWKAGAPDLFTGDIINRGIAGQNTSQMLLRFREDVLDLHPRVLHVMAGVNDINTPAGTVLTKSNIQSMVELAKAHGIKVVLASITPSSHFWSATNVVPGPQIVALNQWLKTYAAAQGLIYVDYWSAMDDGRLGLRGELSNEGLHPNQNGYNIMSPLARRGIEQALAQP